MRYDAVVLSFFGVMDVEFGLRGSFLKISNEILKRKGVRRY
jgi:hypothetical protein